MFLMFAKHFFIHFLNVSSQNVLEIELKISVATHAAEIRLRLHGASLLPLDIEHKSCASVS